MPRPLTFSQACAQYPNRFTLEHVPVWARAPYYHTTAKRYVGYAPHFTTDREWYDNTRFPYEDGYYGVGGDCCTGPHTWPLGEGFLERPYVKGQTAPALVITTGKPAPAAPEPGRYLVTWTIDIFDAASPLEAAQEAFAKIQATDPTQADSAVVFTVQAHGSADVVTVDLGPAEEDDEDNRA